tara:strand:- start:264 stop:467 length:204 start_codon:yes stop_codon:yes gene_type:complete
MRWRLTLLPGDQRALLELAIRLTAELDSAAERQAAAEYGMKLLRDRKISVGSWAKFGSHLGILKGPH